MAIQNEGEVVETSRESDRDECITEAHAEFMRQFIEREDQRNKATVERFLTGKLKQKGVAIRIERA